MYSPTSWVIHKKHAVKMQIPFVFLECRYLLCRITTAAIQLCICLMSVFVYPTTSSTTASYDVRVSGANGCCGHIDYVLRELGGRVTSRDCGTEGLQTTARSATRQPKRFSPFSIDLY